MSNRLLCMVFPDLRRVDAGRLRLWKSAYDVVMRRRKYWLLALGVQVVAQVVGGIPTTRLAARHGWQGVSADFVIPFAWALMACMVLMWLWRRGITAELRAALNAQGLPTCLHCGYDLTGNTSGTCPECGKGVTACG